MTNTRLPHVGTTEYIQLPNLVDGPIPAKIDSGAYDSAIWASSIDEDNGTLSFVLFGPQSGFYTGHIISTTDYSCVKVKNSFGNSEYRYKVKLSIKIANKIYQASFNLADRSRNSFPVLIGKKLLNRRFVIDVSKENIASNYTLDDRTVVLITSRIDKVSREFFQMVKEKMANDLVVVYFKDLRFEITVGSVPRILLPDGRDLAMAGLVYVKNHQLYPEHALTIARYLRYRSVPFIDRELEDGVSRSKLSELFTLAISDVPVPTTMVVTAGSVWPLYDDIKNKFSGAFVVKDAESDRGRNNYLVTDEKSYRTVQQLLESSKIVLIQAYIKNDGFMRILLMGNEVVQVIYRHPSEHRNALKKHLNKPNGGTNADELTKGQYNSSSIVIAQKAAFTMRRNVAGVDIMQDTSTKEWYVLEVNYNPTVVKGINVARRAAGLAKLLDTYNERM